MSIQEKINQIIENFSYFDNWENRYEYLIDLGKKLPKIDEDLKINEFRYFFYIK
jgi:cysteine desulfuration protein SufE